ncbi:hypothetical protein L2E82_39813 [Cichorium intybus]|uniref:Uncharacterized protein n=1 Tax=Cichorium intybus TaxID=13427 RepID=A0ACB9AK84_CICIN|nr:hypothetical protein L2E82_39813 [Cichorium intybus]
MSDAANIFASTPYNLAIQVKVVLRKNSCEYDNQVSKFITPFNYCDFFVCQLPSFRPPFLPEIKIPKTPRFPKIGMSKIL